MKLTYKELMDKLKPIIGESTDEATLSLLADIKDTVDSDTEGYKEKYEKEVADRKADNDAWAKRYRDTFFNPEVSDDIEKDKGKEKEEKEDEEKELTFDNLFKEKED